MPGNEEDEAEIFRQQSEDAQALSTPEVEQMYSSMFSSKGDAQAAIDAIRNPIFHARTTHIAVKFRWLQSFVQENNRVLDITHVGTSDMVADLLTEVVAHRIWLALSPLIVSDDP